MEHRKRKKGKINRKVLLTVTVVICVFLSISLAWYYYNTRRVANSEDREVMVPYYLYLLDENRSDYFQLQVLNMHPDEKKQVIVCVSNEDKDGSQLSYSIGRSSVFNYELEMAYTQNIPLDYTIYELEKVDASMASDTDVFVTSGNNYWRKKKTQTSDSGAVLPLQPEETLSNEKTASYNTEMYGEDYATQVENIAKYQIYQKDAEGEQFKLTTTLNGTIPQYEHHYYMIEIQWDDNIRDFNQYLKEVDLVYVIVKAVQPEPEEKTGTTTNVTDESINGITSDVPQKIGEE